MKNFLIVLILLIMTSDKTLYNFKNQASIKDWEVEDDTVMGGRSQGNLSFSDSGYAVFSGAISLKNNGGFSSMQADIETIDVQDYSAISLEVKGDGKTYNFRVKEKAGQKHAYTQEFKTNGEWQTIELPFNQFSPTYRGNTLDIPNYSGNTLGHLRILIGNKKEQTFKLLIKTIGLK